MEEVFQWYSDIENQQNGQRDISGLNAHGFSLLPVGKVPYGNRWQYNCDQGDACTFDYAADHQKGKAVSESAHHGTNQGKGQRQQRGCPLAQSAQNQRGRENDNCL